MILLTVQAVGREAGIRTGLAAALLAATAPLPAAMAVHGLADLPLGCLFAAAVLAVERWDGTRRDAGWLAVAGLLAGLMTTYKREGGPLRLVVVALVALRAVTGGGSPWRSLRTAAAPAAAFVVMAAVASLPWAYTYRELSAFDWVVNEETMAPSTVLPRLAVLPEVAGALLGHLLARSSESAPLWSATYVMIGVVALLWPRLLLRRDRLPSTLALGAGIAGYCFIYVLSPFGLYHMVSSFGRILLHFYPLAAILAARAAAEAWAARRDL
jgi:hypothetical protein